MNPLIHKAFPINELQRIKKWQVAHRQGHEIEYQAWDAMLTLWLMGAVGSFSVVSLGEAWALPLCAAGIAAPELYIYVRRKAHQKQKLRCDWIHLTD